MNWLNIVSKDHLRWVSIVNSFGQSNDPEDIVQDMYLKLHKMYEATIVKEQFYEKIIKDDKTNGAYIRIVLFNLFLDSKKQETKRKETSLDDMLFKLEQPAPIELNNEFDIQLEKEKSNWHNYDRILFDLYSQKKLSMRDIATGAGIPLKSIFNTIKKCKQKVKKLEIYYYRND